MVFAVINGKMLSDHVPEKIFLNRTSRSKVMNIFQITSQYYAIACNTCKVHAHSFFIIWTVHSLLCQLLKNSLKISTVVFEKGTSGYLAITSSIYLNWNISVIYFQIDIKLVLINAEWRWLLFRKKHFAMSLPVSQTWRHIRFNCRSFSFFYFGLSHNLFRVVWVAHVTLRSYKQKRSTEGCSKFKSPETRQVQERLVSTLEHMQVPKWDRTRCPEE